MLIFLSLLAVGLGAALAVAEGRVRNLEAQCESLRLSLAGSREALARAHQQAIIERAMFREGAFEQSESASTTPHYVWRIPDGIYNSLSTSGTIEQAWDIKPAKKSKPKKRR
jgi:hypothetical protein